MRIFLRGDGAANDLSSDLNVSLLRINFCKPTAQTDDLSAFHQPIDPTTILICYRLIGESGASMLTCSGSASRIDWRYFGLFVMASVIVVSVQSAVAFEDRFGESLPKHRAQYTDSRRDSGSMDYGTSGRGGRGDRGDGMDSRGDDGGGPGPGGRGGPGPDDHNRGPGPGGDDGGPNSRGRGPGR